MVGGVALVVTGLAWWLVSGALLDRGEKPDPLSGRAWAGHTIYAVGSFPMFLGLSQLQDEVGWGGAAAGVGVALAVVAVAFLVALLVVRARRRVRRGRQESAR